MVFRSNEHPITKVINVTDPLSTSFKGILLFVRGRGTGKAKCYKREKQLHIKYTLGIILFTPYASG